MSQFLGASFVRGEVTQQRVAIGEYPDGTEIRVPIATCGGVSDGPTLYVQAGLHGDEVTGIEIARTFIQSLKPLAGNIAGKVVVVPTLNVASHNSHARGYLHEERRIIDVNRIFPGRARGLLSERLANLVIEEFVEHSDMVVDLHSALNGCDIVPMVWVDPADDDNGTLTRRESMARAFGAPFIFRKPRTASLGTSDMTRSLTNQADVRGRSALGAEMGQSNRISRAVVPLGVRGLHNVLRALGMTPGEPEVTMTPRDLSQIDIVHTDRGGFLQLDVELGEEVTAAQVVARVTDAFGETVEVLRSPSDGVVMRIMLQAATTTGAEAVWVAS